MAEEPPPPGVERLRLHFYFDKLEEHLPHLPPKPTKEDYLAAFQMRDEVARLFLGPDPFFLPPFEQGDLMCRHALEQVCL